MSYSNLLGVSSYCLGLVLNNIGDKIIVSKMLINYKKKKICKIALTATGIFLMTLGNIILCKNYFQSDMYKKCKSYSKGISKIPPSILDYSNLLASFSSLCLATYVLYKNIEAFVLELKNSD
jgi:hypothetical protein